MNSQHRFFVSPLIMMFFSPTETTLIKIFAFMYYSEAANYNIYNKLRMKINFFVNEIHLSYSVDTELVSANLSFVFICFYTDTCFINAL
jgi:hypothetical protein